MSYQAKINTMVTNILNSTKVFIGMGSAGLTFGGSYLALANYAGLGHFSPSVQKVGALASIIGVIGLHFYNEIRITEDFVSEAYPESYLNSAKQKIVE